MEQYGQSENPASGSWEEGHLVSELAAMRQRNEPFGREGKAALQRSENALDGGLKGY